MWTILGFVPGLFVFLSFGVVSLLSYALTSVLAGVVLARWWKQEDGMYWAWASLGAMVLTFITMLPYVGWFVRLALFLMAFGTICTLFHEYVWQRRSAVPAEAEPAEESDTKEDTDITEDSHDEENTANKDDEK